MQKCPKCGKNLYMADVDWMNSNNKNTAFCPHCEIDWQEANEWYDWQLVEDILEDWPENDIYIAGQRINI